MIYIQTKNQDANSSSLFFFNTAQTNKHHLKRILVCNLIVNRIYYGWHSKFLCKYMYTEPNNERTMFLITFLFYATFYRNLNYSFMASVFKFQTDFFSWFCRATIYFITCSPYWYFCECTWKSGSLVMEKCFALLYWKRKLFM